MSATDWFNHVQAINPLAKDLYASNTREEFLDAAERLLERVVGQMEADRATFRQLDEPGLTHLMPRLLGDLVPSKPETHTNGHVDVTIWHPRNLGFHYLVEGKIWRGGRWHRDGMRQVLGYATGREGRVMCLAFFIRHKRMNFLLTRLRAQLATATDPASTGPSEDHPFLLAAFMTPHLHSSELPLKLVHYGCYLWEEGVEDLGEDEEA